MNRSISEEMDSLKNLYGTIQFESELDRLYEKYRNNTEAKLEIADYLREGVAASGRRIEQLALQIQPKEIAD